MRDNRLKWLWILLIVQAACAAFFVIDAIADWAGLEGAANFRHFHSFEMFVALALVAGLGTTVYFIRDLAQRQVRLTRQIGIASGAFTELMEAQFDQWGLSASERDVATMSIKGLSIAEIAAMRQTKEGTVKAQNAAVYRKAGVSGRMQLLSLFIEDLMADALVRGPDA